MSMCDPIRSDRIGPDPDQDDPKSEKRKRALLENSYLKRLEILFNITPIVTNNNFEAANIIYQDTEYKASFNLRKIILISGVFGIIFGIFYVHISNAIQQRK